MASALYIPTYIITDVHDFFFLTAETKDSSTAFQKAIICNSSLEGHHPLFLTGQTLSTKSCVAAQAAGKTESKYSMMMEMKGLGFYSVSVACPPAGHNNHHLAPTSVSSFSSHFQSG